MARRSEVELCFDSMSDLITNLAGGLILVVMLLLALTREAPKTVDSTPLGGAGRSEAEKSTRSLTERLIQLRLESERVNEEIAADEASIKELDQKAVSLIKRIQDQNAKDKK